MPQIDYRWLAESILMCDTRDFAVSALIRDALDFYTDAAVTSQEAEVARRLVHALRVALGEEPA